MTGLPVQAHTDAGTGYLCTWPGRSPFFDDFFTFATHGTTLSGQVAQADVSVLAIVPMTGTVRGNHVTFLPLSGFGRFQGSMSGSNLSLFAADGDGPTVSIHCSLVTDANWRKTVPSMGLKGPQRSAPDTVATYDLTLANLGAHAADWSGTTVADGNEAWPIKVTTGPVSAAHDVSVTVSTDDKVRVEATRSTSGRCWYLVNNDEASAGNGGIVGLPRMPPGEKLVYASPRGEVASTCNSGPVETVLRREG